LTTPNLLTIVRIVAIPFVLWLTHSGGRWGMVAAAGLYVLAIATDWADGYIARRRGTVTALGALMDPTADKVLVLGLFFVFADKGLLPLWLVLINLFREFLVSGLRQVCASQGRVVAANWMGKSKFVMQVLVILAAYLHLVPLGFDASPPLTESMIFYGALGMTVVSVLFAVRFTVQHMQTLAQAA